MDSRTRRRHVLAGLLMSVFFLMMMSLPHTSTGLAQTPSPPAFGGEVPTRSPLRTCLQGHFELDRSAVHTWYIRAANSGGLTVGIHAVAVNPIEESGSITAALFDSAGGSLGTVTVLHPTGTGFSPGAENTASMNVTAPSAGSIYRLTIQRGAPTRAGTRDARHYRIRLSGVSASLAINSPGFHYFEDATEELFVNVAAGERFQFRVFAESGYGADTATGAVLSIAYLSGTPVLAQTTVSFPFTLDTNVAAAGTLRVAIDADGQHFQVDKQSGDRGIYFGHCGRERLLVAADIHPQSCPNPINTNSRGVLPVAIAGTADFDVTTIRQDTVRIAGVLALAGRTAFEDVVTPFVPEARDPTACTTAGADGFMDLTFKFDTQQVIQALEVRLGRSLVDGEVLTLRVKGDLTDGTPFVGRDVVVIVKKR